MKKYVIICLLILFCIIFISCSSTQEMNKSDFGEEKTEGNEEIIERKDEVDSQEDIPYGWNICTDDDNNQTEISDSWEEIIESIDNGTYIDKYQIGNIKNLDLGPEGVVEMQIAAFNVDELADTDGYAAITWLSKNSLNTTHYMNESLPQHGSQLKEGMGGIGGWEHSEMRAWLKEHIKPLIPDTVTNAVKPVKKYSYSCDKYGRNIQNAVSIDEVWIPSHREIFCDSEWETVGPKYKELFSFYSYEKNGDYGLRTGGSYSFLSTGVYQSAGSPHRVVLGFCT